MATISAGTVDVYVVSWEAGEWHALVLRRGPTTRCPGSWEAVHGHIESGEEPEDAAIREVREETGLAVQRLYNVTVQPFYLHAIHTIELAVVFAAFVDRKAVVTRGAEHDASEWLPAKDALGRYFWPRERAALREIMELYASGNGGEAEDVLRVR